MKYNHLSQNERYQISNIMKIGLNCTQIAEILGRCKSTISREIRRNKQSRGYRPKQTDQLARKKTLLSRNARRIAEQLSPEQVAAKLPISHEALYHHIYVIKAVSGHLWKNLRCQKRKEGVMAVEIADPAKSSVDALFTSVLQVLSCAGLSGTGSVIQ